MSEEEKAESLFASGCNCAQSVFGAFSEELGLDEELAKRLSCGLGGGVGRMREVCGAVSAAALVIGARIGSDKAQVYPAVQDFCAKFKEAFGSVVCRDLLAGAGATTGGAPEPRTPAYYEKRPCARFVRFAAAQLAASRGKALALAAALLCFGTVYGTEMDGKAKVYRTVDTVRSGVAEITCDDPKGWTFDATAGLDNGRDVVTVRVTSPVEAVPPQFGVFFRVSGAGVRHVWNCDFTRPLHRVDPRLWWFGGSKYQSCLAQNAPIAVAYNDTEHAPVALACSEAFNFVQFGLYVDDRTCDLIGRCEFFTQPTAATKTYVVKVMLDRRGSFWYDAVRDCSAWIAAENGFRAAYVPEAARDPLYSTWYAYLQDVRAGALEKEAALAASMGMKTMILDDGWQKLDSRTFYSACGDWMPVADRFPDMKGHVAAVHKAGLKYMLWLAVPFMGEETQHYAQFKDKLLHMGDGCGTLDPRFPEVREYLISTYERVIRDWDFDGVKLDFIDSFALPAKDPAIAQNYAGRDYRSLPQAVDRLMRDVLARLRVIKPDVLVEFRQRYMGPAIRQYGNMIRAADCPADIGSNRRRICDLRLTSGDTAVHSDMLVWSRDETPEGAALPILSVLFSTIQYSMILDTVKPEHREVIRAWLAFSQAHRDTLLKGDFRPHHPENGYSWIEAESARERIVAVYAPNVCVGSGAADKSVCVVNATSSDSVTVDLPAKPARIDLFDVLGRPAGEATASAGLARLRIPKSGRAQIVW